MKSVEHVVPIWRESRSDGIHTFSHEAFQDHQITRVGYDAELVSLLQSSLAGGTMDLGFVRPANLPQAKNCHRIRD